MDVERVKITATTTAKVPNTSATAASPGTDLNGKAAQSAARQIRQRLVQFATKHFEVKADHIEFKDNQVILGDKMMSFSDFIDLAYHNRVSLSSTGFYSTPKIFTIEKSLRQTFLLCVWCMCQRGCIRYSNW